MNADDVAREIERRAADAGYVLHPWQLNLARHIANGAQIDLTFHYSRMTERRHVELLSIIANTIGVAGRDASIYLANEQRARSFALDVDRAIGVPASRVKGQIVRVVHQSRWHEMTVYVVAPNHKWALDGMRDRGLNAHDRRYRIVFLTDELHVRRTYGRRFDPIVDAVLWLGPAPTWPGDGLGVLDALVAIGAPV